jgi:putative hydrolase of the HAD superfamily
VKVLVFDLDDTLFPERHYVLSGFRAVDNWLSATHSIDGFFKVALGLHDGGLRGRVFDEALCIIGQDPDPQLVRSLVNVYRNHDPQIALYSDAKWAIRFFRKYLYLSIITDGYLGVQRKKVASLGISPRFDAIVYSDEFGRRCWKPSPVPYLQVMRAFGCKGSECLYVGDNPIKDFVGAKAFGWMTVRIAREGGEHSGVIADEAYEAHLRIDSLFELRDIVLPIERAVPRAFPGGVWLYPGFPR